MQKSNNPLIVIRNREVMTQLLYKAHPSLRAVQKAFYRKGVVAQKKIKAIKNAGRF